MNIPKRTYVLLACSMLFLLTKSMISVFYYWLDLYHFRLNDSFEVFLRMLGELSIPLCLVFFVASMLILCKAFLQSHANNRSRNSNIEELRKRLVKEDEKGEENKDVLELMFNNMSEIQAYYTISKQHAQLSFILALVCCVLGFILFVIALSSDIENQQPVIIGLVGGTVSELFAGTALIVHKKSLSQLNRYYIALHENERFLSTVNLVDRLPKEKQDEVIVKIIDNSLANITNLVIEFANDNNKTS